MNLYNPPHKATDEPKIKRMIEAIRSGERLSQIVVCGETALSGSHRIEAYRRAKQLADHAVGDGWELAQLDAIPAVMITDEEYSAACTFAGVGDLDEIGDCNAACAAVYASSIRADVRDALADQR